MFESIKRRLGMMKRVHSEHQTYESTIMSSYPQKGWLIRNPSFVHKGVRRNIASLGIADFEASGTDQFSRRVLPDGGFDYEGLRIAEFVNCKSLLNEAGAAKEEIAEFMIALQEAKSAVIEVKFSRGSLKIDLKKIPIPERPKMITIGPRGGKRAGYDDELDMSEEEMMGLCHDILVD